MSKKVYTPPTVSQAYSDVTFDNGMITFHGVGDSYILWKTIRHIGWDVRTDLDAVAERRKQANRNDVLARLSVPGKKERDIDRKVDAYLRRANGKFRRNHERRYGAAGMG